MARERSALAQEESIEPGEAAFEHIMLGLRLARGVNLVHFEKTHGFDLRARYGEAIARHARNGLVTLRDDAFCLTQLGMDLQNLVLMDFMDAHR